MMGSRPCDVIPPMPALIPIAALRNTTITNKQCNNNVTAVNCTPCIDQQRQYQHQIVLEEDNADIAVNSTTTSSSDEEEGDDEDDDDDDINDGRIGDCDIENEDNMDVEVRCDMKTDVRQPAGPGVAGGATKQHQRSRRPARQVDAVDDNTEQRIDAAPSGGDTSRDRGNDGPQAPARRAAAAATAAARRQPEPRHHRKSDHRRHRSERLLLLQQQQQQLLQQQKQLLQQQEQQRRRRQQRRRHRTTSNSSSAASYSSNSASVTSGSSGSVCDERTRSTVQQQQHQHQHQQQTAAARVNPIFVWVRQEDTRIVDVRCEDYDKRNRILLTKTAHGWRAIPRTETLTTTLEETPVSNNNKHEEQNATTTTINRSIRKPRNRKSNKTKRCRPTVSTIVDESTITQSSAVENEKSRITAAPLAWTVPVNVESHLPSHTIPVLRHSSSPVSCDGDINQGDGASSVDASLVADADSSGVNNDVREITTTPLIDSVNSAESHAPECCGAVVSDVISPLDNLLAVAELEFNQQQHHEQQIDEDIDKKENLIEDDETQKPPETTDCDYNDEDDENHLAMTDILERLEQSLQSPMEDEIDADAEIEINLNSAEDVEEDEDGVNNIYLDDERIDTSTSDPQCYEMQPLPEEDEIETEQEVESHEKRVEEMFNVELPTDLSVKPTKITLDISEDELPTDLSKHCKVKETISHEVEEIQEDDMQPTDLSIRKHSILSSALHIDTPRPPSQNSETIQSPQPSGIPAVPPSPDIYINNKSSNKSLFLESLLSSPSPKLALTPEVTITRNQKEPLDLGKSRKSASPTVTCSEEAKNNGEPVTKKIRIEDITLKNLLHAEKQKTDVKHAVAVSSQKQSDVSQQNVESSRLLELLTTDPEPDPVTQLKQILSHVDLNIPDPLLVPKDRLSSILSAPAREIPKLLNQRPELRLPEALAYPQLLQDPDILVITLAQLQTILQKQSQPIAALQEKTKEDKPVEKVTHKSQPQQTEKPTKTDATVSHISNDYRRFQPLQQQQLRVGDVDAATTAAFNQMLWLPYLNHLEAAALATGNNSDFFKALNSVYPPQMADLSLFGARHPMSTLPVPNFQPILPPIDYTNPLEMAMWQEAMLQANLQQQQQQQQQRPKLSYGNESADRANMLKKYHQLGASASRSQSSARTSPISHSYYQQQQQQRLPHHFGYPFTGMRPNLQIPQYNPVQHSTKRSVHKQNQFPQKYNNHHLAQQQQQHQQSAQAYSQKSPRVTCKSLQNLLSPTVSKSPVLAKSSNPLGVQPMDLSAPYPSTKMLKSKQSFLDPMTATAAASFNNKMWKHEDVPEVGSTTEEMTSSHLHETQTHLWHPLFGK